MSRDEEFDDAEEDEELEPGGERSPRWRRRHLTGACLGFLAMTPLLVVYELGVSARDGLVRNGSELLVFRAFSLLGPAADPARWATLALVAVVAAWICHRREVAPIPQAARIGMEGALGALVIGPLVVWSLALLGGSLRGLEVHAQVHSAPPARPPSLEEAALVVGGAAYEELLFRVLLFGLVFLLTRRVAQHFGAPRRVGRVLSEVVAALVSSLLFAAFHLAAFLPGEWGGGEEFVPGVFAWRALAGLFLCVLFRWRGPGVAAWTHGLFNLALLLGAGPEVLL